MDKWKCTVCKYVIESDTLPTNCPDCKAGAEHKFKLIGKKLRKGDELMG